MSQKPNPLIPAADAYDRLMDAIGDIMFDIAGEKAFEPFDDSLCDQVETLVWSSADGATKLSSRARHARLNLIWRDFLKNQSEKK